MSRRVLVYGPAYLDRVLRVEGPLVDPSQGGPLDRSVEAGGLSGDGPSLRLVDSLESTLEIDPPPLWPGPTGILRLGSALVTPGGWTRQVKGTDWLDDLGGMGAGYAKALDGVLVSALGGESDPMSNRIRSLLDEAEVTYRPVTVPDHAADWTLLITSGPSGDKLPIGFRGCHAALSELPTPASLDLVPDLIVAAGLRNALVEPLFRSAPGAVRVWAPSLRCLTDRSFPASKLAGLVDVLACNREEWAALEDREALEESVWVRSVTYGPRGASLYYRSRDGSQRMLSIPAFPRDRPPRDTNRAGEAFASTLVSALLDAGWRPGPLDPEEIVGPAVRASAASALVLDLERFGFPSSHEVDLAVARGRVP